MHTHVHLIPRKDNDGLKLWPQKKDYPKDKLESLAVKIKTFLK
jgi:diadenosine tetraphosphate (Ap4A) HIT family hydrolase